MTRSSTATGTSCSRSCGVAQTGIQLLAGFLLTLPFTQVFDGIDAAQKTLYLSLVVIAGVAVGLNLTPIMLHRRVFREHVKDRVVETGQVLSQIVIAAVAVLVVGTSVLIFSVVTAWAPALVAGAALALVLTTLLYVRTPPSRPPPSSGGG